MKLARSVAVCAFPALLLAHSLSGAPLTDAQLVESAIAAEVRTEERAVIEQRRDESRARLVEKTAQGASNPVGGVIVFARGLESKEVAQFAAENQFDVLRAEAKVAVGDDGIAHTMSFGARSIFMLDGPLDERLEKLVGQQRGRLFAAAQAPEASDVAGLREAAYSRNIRFYKVEVVGPASSFNRVEKSSEAAAVFVDSSTEKVMQLAEQRETSARMKSAGRPIIGRPFAEGIPPELRGRVVVFPGGPPVAPPDPPSQQPVQPSR